MITLVNVSSSEFLYSPPLGLLYVGGALRKAGYEVEILHFPPTDIEKYAKEIAAKDPLFVGISLFTSNQTKFSADLSRIIKERCDSPVVWGGVHPSMISEQTIGESYVDVIVIGEGEETVVDLADAIENKRDLRDVMGIGFKRNGEQVITGQRPLIKNLDDYRLDWELVDVERYLVPMLSQKRTLNYITSRGCPYRCGFCYNLRFNRGRWRGHSREFVISEINNLKEQYGIDGIRFYDDNFFANKKRAIDILKAIDLPWEGEFRIASVTDELAQDIRDTKCQGICFGIESGNDRILDLIQKDQKVEDIVKGIKIMSRYPEVRVSGCIMLANPTETKEEIRNTINLCLDLWKIHRRIIFTIGTFLPYPGVPLYDLVLSTDYVPPKNTEDWQVVNRGNKNMEVSWLPWVTKKDRQDFVYAGRYAQLLQLGNLRIPLINKAVYWRLSKYNFRFPVELRFLEWLNVRFTNRDSWLSRTARRLLPHLKYKEELVKAGK